MAEVLGVVSAIAGLISLSGAVLSEGYSYLGIVRRAPKELRQLLSEVATLDTVLGQLEGLVDGDQGLDSGSKSALNELNNSGVFKECKELLLSVRRSVAACQQVAGEPIKNFGKMVVWPFKEKETKDLLTRLSRLRELLHTALAVDNSMVLRSVHQHSRQISTAVEELQARAAAAGDAEEHERVFKWLEPNSIKVDDNLNEGLEHHHPGTGKWLFEYKAYLSWLEESSSLLWIHGIPGSGKTVLASSVIHTLLQEESESQNVVYFFCDHRHPAKRTLNSFLGAVALQLLSRSPDLVQEAKKLFQTYGGDPGNAIRTADLLNLLMTLVMCVGNVTIVIDALDECNELESFVSSLENILDTENAIVRILATSRPDYALQKSVGGIAVYTIALEQNSRSDINAFVAGEVSTRVATRKIRIRSPELKELIILELSSNADGMFLWVKFQLDLISRLTNDKAIREALHKLPKGLDETYVRLLEQVKERNAHDLETVCKLLTWIISSLVPLTLNELVEAISIEPDDSERDLSKMVTDPNDLLDMLGSLVVVDRTQEDPVVTLAHFTVDEFLRSERLRKHENLSMFCVTSNGFFTVGLAFAQYLSFSDFRNPCRTVAELDRRLFAHKLLGVASHHWFIQIRSYGGRGPMIRKFIPRLKWFLEGVRDEDKCFVSWQQVYHRSISGLPPPNPLLYAVHFGMVNLFDILIQKGADTRVLLRQHYSQLAVAVIGGQDDLVASFLQANPTTNLEKQYVMGATCLHLAAGYGHASTVRLLLEAGASPHARSESQSTPFYRAARSGSIPTMALLLDAGSAINAETWDAWTAIFEAIESQHTEAVAWLVSKGANLKQKINDNTSVLEFANYSGNMKIVQIIEDGLRSD